MEEAYYPVEVESKLSSVDRYAVVQFGKSIEKIAGGSTIELLADNFVKRFFSRLETEGRYSETKKQGTFHLIYDTPSASRITYLESKKGEKIIEVITLKKMSENARMYFESYIVELLNKGK